MMQTENAHSIMFKQLKIKLGNHQDACAPLINNGSQKCIIKAFSTPAAPSPFSKVGCNEESMDTLLISYNTDYSL